MDPPAGVDRQVMRTEFDLLKWLNQQHRSQRVDIASELDARIIAYELAFRMQTEAPEVVDLSTESAATRELYGLDGKSTATFGRQCLLARRLVESGVPFVTIRNGGWDHHGQMLKRLDANLPPTERGVSALIEDLEQRGLLDSTLVVMLGEFGRTPTINKGAGRDHWSNAMSVLMAGGRTPGGTVIGATDRKGYSAVEHVLGPENFVSTVYSKLGINPDKVLYTPEGRPVHLVSNPKPIHDLMHS